MENQEEHPFGHPEEYILGTRMKASVVDRLDDTLVQFAHASPQLDKLHQRLQQDASDEELTPLSLTEIVYIVKQQASGCPLIRKLHENLVRDIYMRAKYSRKWRTNGLYLTDSFVLSSEIYKPKK